VVFVKSRSIPLSATGNPFAALIIEFHYLSKSLLAIEVTARKEILIDPCSVSMQVYRLRF
jgi:hypothetical protein